MSCKNLKIILTLEHASKGILVDARFQVHSFHYQIQVDEKEATDDADGNVSVQFLAKAQNIITQVNHFFTQVNHLIFENFLQQTSHQFCRFFHLKFGINWATGSKVMPK